LLKANNKLRERIANNGYKLFKGKCVPKVIGKKIMEYLLDLKD